MQPVCIDTVIPKCMHTYKQIYGHGCMISYIHADISETHACSLACLTMYMHTYILKGHP